MSRIEEVIQALEGDQEFLSCVTHWERIPPRSGEYADLPGDLASVLREALVRRGIERLYSHQSDAYELARGGRSFVVVTPTASGKTLCYNLPVLQSILESPDDRALYMFPTKALSQDQQSELNDSVLMGELPVKIATYDGDTPTSLRASARDTGQIVITNPDMLHSGILPNHPKWIKFLKSLRFVVIDEIHTYRGIFGSHLTNVIRRVKRIAEFYGSSPIFICCSATIGNPKELTEQLLEQSVELIDKNGSPSGEKHVVLYNPPLVDPVQGIRRGVVNEGQRIAAKLLKSGIKTIVFARSRVRTELIASYIKQSLANFYTDNGRINIESYRGGYLPNERRGIERGLRDGSIQGVVSTNALELGIDIGGLDAAVLAGFPGSISSSWQQAGRAGRRSTISLAILVASSSPLDQYMVKHPEYFFGRAPEKGFVDPNNMYIMLDHLKCAAFEVPFGVDHHFPETAPTYMDYLEEQGVVRRTGGKYYWSDRSYPAEEISLRSATADNVVIVDTTGGRHEVIGETDRPAAKETLFDNAIYIHRGNQFVVTQLDLDNRRAYVEATDVKYYTDAIVKRDIKVLHEDLRETVDGSLCVTGDILVRSQVSRFKKIRYRTHENVGFGEISLPEEQMHTRSVAIVFAEGTPAGEVARELPAEMIGPVIARIGTLFKNVAGVFLLCDAGDIGVAERYKDPHFDAPCLYIYDAYPGGSGMADSFLRSLHQVLSAASDLVGSCSCSEGCPSCVGPRDPSEEIDANPKTAAKLFLSRWLAGLVKSA